ncbi:MAG: hypothetical protein WDN25_05820 [Acetobacteraceae bacterium]
MVLAVLYPIVYLWNYFVGGPLLDSHGVPFWLALFIGNVVSTQLLGWWAVPAAFGRFGWWLAPKAGLRAQIAGYVAMAAFYVLSMAVYAGLLAWNWGTPLHGRPRARRFLATGGRHRHRDQHRAGSRGGAGGSAGRSAGADAALAGGRRQAALPRRRCRQGHRRQDPSPAITGRGTSPAGRGSRAMRSWCWPTGRMPSSWDSISRRWGEDLRPDRLVLGDDLLRDGLLPPFGGCGRPRGVLRRRAPVPRGQAPRLLGQPLALLIYHDFARFAAARRRARFAGALVRWDGPAAQAALAHYGATRFVRIAGARDDEPDLHSPLEGATVFGRFDGDSVVWPAADPGGEPMQRAMWAAGEIDRAIADAGSDAVVLRRSYFSQSVDAIGDGDR